MPLPEPNENRESWTSITSFNTQKLPIILIGGVFIVIIIASVASGILLYRRERHKYVITDKGKDAMNRKIEDD